MEILVSLKKQPSTITQNLFKSIMGDHISVLKIQLFLWVKNMKTVTSRGFNNNLHYKLLIIMCIRCCYTLIQKGHHDDCDKLVEGMEMIRLTNVQCLKWQSVSVTTFLFQPDIFIQNYKSVTFFIHILFILLVWSPVWWAIDTLCLLIDC